VRVAPARSAAVRGAAVELAVRDTGVGIAPDLLTRIWDPYVTQKDHGTGLGLAIARQTVAAHGGAVDAASAVGCGTEIRFVLPVDGGRTEGAPTSWTAEHRIPAPSAPHAPEAASVAASPGSSSTRVSS
jgi:nitrogen-specific signal transduction histidine kinase